MEECISHDDSFVEPLTGWSSTGDTSGISAGGPIDCRGYSEELTAFLLRGVSAGNGSHDVSYVNRVTVGSELTSIGLPPQDDAHHSPGMKHNLAFANQAAGPQQVDAVPLLSSVSRDRETTRKVGDRLVPFEPPDFRPR